jgi:hypothetical protein
MLSQPCPLDANLSVPIIGDTITAPALEIPLAICEDINPIHPYILEALQAARAGDLQAARKADNTIRRKRADLARFEEYLQSAVSTAGFPQSARMRR